MIGTKDGRGRINTDLFVCAIQGNSGTSITPRFGAANLVDAIEGAKEFAATFFAEVAHEYLASILYARPNSDDTVVITLTGELTGERHHVDDQIPIEFQPNAYRSEPDVFDSF